MVWCRSEIFPWEMLTSQGWEDQPFQAGQIPLLEVFDFFQTMVLESSSRVSFLVSIHSTSTASMFGYIPRVRSPPTETLVTLPDLSRASSIQILTNEDRLIVYVCYTVDESEDFPFTRLRDSDNCTVVIPGFSPANEIAGYCFSGELKVFHQTQWTILLDPLYSDSFDHRHPAL